MKLTDNNYNCRHREVVIVKLKNLFYSMQYISPKVADAREKKDAIEKELAQLNLSEAYFMVKDFYNFIEEPFEDMKATKISAITPEKVPNLEHKFSEIHARLTSFQKTYENVQRQVNGS